MTSSQNRRIVFPLEGFGVNGGNRIIISIANALAERGHRVSFIVPDYASSVPFPLHDSISVRVLRTRGPQAIKKLSYLFTLCIVSTAAADVSVATGYKTPYYLCASKMLLFSGAKLVYLIQGYEPLSHVRDKAFGKMLLTTFAKLGYRLPLKKIAVSEWLKDMVNDETTTVISNGIDLSVFRQGEGPDLPRDTFTIGTVGHNSRSKGYDVFLRAMEHIPANERCGLKVLVASRTDLQLPQEIPSQQIRPGSERELVNFYRSCDVFVCTSAVEGFGLTPLEAMACGIPVVTTDFGGNRQYARECNCVIVPVGDSAAVSNAIIKLRRNKSLRESLRRNALETSRHFSLEEMGAAYHELFSQI